MERLLKLLLRSLLGRILRLVHRLVCRALQSIAHIAMPADIDLRHLDFRYLDAERFRPLQTKKRAPVRSANLDELPRNSDYGREDS